jgi:hypothetical protein
MAASQTTTELHQAVLACLQQTTGPDRQGIKAAEAQLPALAQQPGFGVVLVQVALASPQEVPAHLRQLAAVLLKQYVKQHWIQGERGFVPPETSKADKAHIRNALPAGLRDPDSKIRTAVAMAIAAVANWDWPQDWPGLLESIVSSIKQRDDGPLGESPAQQYSSSCLASTTHTDSYQACMCDVSTRRQGRSQHLLQTCTHRPKSPPL